MIEVIQGKKQEKIQCKAGQSILECLREAGYEMSAVCSGNGTCGKCQVQILEGAPLSNERERDLFSLEEIEAGFRLSCAHDIQPGMKIKVKKNRTYQSVASFADIAAMDEAHAGESKGYGIAVDLGTTTVALGLVSLENREMIQVSSFLNPQSSYGADVISRIRATKEYGVEVLRDLIRDQLKESVEDLCTKVSIPVSEIREFAIAGNTSMLYLLQGYDPKELAAAPFTVSHSAYKEYDASDFFSREWIGTVRIFPCISAYVGGDIVAGIYAYEDELLKNQPACLLDLGTNGEIVLMNRDQIVCAAAAAGPAFEGAGIHSGIGGVAGAISTLRMEGDRILFTTIDEVDPIGICGSGIIDVVSEGIRIGAIDSTGRMAGGDLILCEKPRRIAFTQKDVREVQLAKAAIAAGIKVLAGSLEIGSDEFETFLIAGGFGRYLDRDHAGNIGLIPRRVIQKAKSIGNSSLAGAYKALFDTGLEMNLERIRKKCAYIELASQSDFNRIFIEEMSFKKCE